MEESPQIRRKLSPSRLHHYGIDMHRHNFAVWAAARAVQRGFAKATVEAVRRAIKACGIESYLKDGRRLPTTDKAFNAVHRKWCNSIRKNLGGATCYGQAAKIVAIYLKTTVVIPHQAGNDEHELKKCCAIRWTKLNEKPYFELMGELREYIGDQPFWKLETFWNGERQSPHQL
jgi:hypothetical protein